MKSQLTIESSDVICLMFYSLNWWWSWIDLCKFCTSCNIHNIYLNKQLGDKNITETFFCHFHDLMWL